MVSWWWVLVALFAGGIIGIFAVCMIAANRVDEDQDEHGRIS